MFIIDLFSQEEGQAIIHKISFEPFTDIQGLPGSIKRHIASVKVCPKRHKVNAKKIGLNAAGPRLSNNSTHSKYKKVGSMLHWFLEKYEFTLNSKAFDSLSNLCLTNLAADSNLRHYMFRSWLKASKTD